MQYLCLSLHMVITRIGIKGCLEPSVLMCVVIGVATHDLSAQPLFPTGVDETGQRLPDGARDPHYEIVANPNFSAVAINEGLIPLNWWPRSVDPSSTLPPASRWIWEQFDGLPTNVVRTIRTTFDLTGLLDPEEAFISGMWTVDNSGEIFINGVSTGQAIGRTVYGHLHAFRIYSGFVPGVNTLDFVVTDDGHISGLLVESISLSLVPEPGGASLLLVVIVAVCTFRKKDGRRPVRLQTDPP